MPRLKLEEDFEKINRELKEGIDEIDNLISLSISSLESLDEGMKETIDNLNLMIYHKLKYTESLCINTIALQSPVAKDLRKIITILEILTDLDRIGRYAYDIFLEIPFFKGSGGVRKLQKIPVMSEMTQHMINSSITSLLNEDDVLAQGLILEDDKVDELYSELMREVIENIKKDSTTVEHGIHYILIARYLERMADHSVNIGDRVVYLKKGKTIIHK